MNTINTMNQNERYTQLWLQNLVRMNNREKEKWSLNKTEVDKGNDFHQGLKNYYDYNEAKKVFGNGSHNTKMWHKYKYRYGFDSFGYYNSLDCLSQDKLISWYNIKLKAV